jgi:hypothetical protein
MRELVDFMVLIATNIFTDRATPLPAPRSRFGSYKGKVGGNRHIANS